MRCTRDTSLKIASFCPAGCVMQKNMLCDADARATLYSELASYLMVEEVYAQSKHTITYIYRVRMAVDQPFMHAIWGI
jgi:hypothetical protein